MNGPEYDCLLDQQNEFIARLKRIQNDIRGSRVKLKSASNSAKEGDIIQKNVKNENITFSENLFFHHSAGTTHGWFLFFNKYARCGWRNGFSLTPEHDKEFLEILNKISGIL